MSFYTVASVTETGQIIYILENASGRVAVSSYELMEEYQQDLLVPFGPHKQTAGEDSLVTYSSVEFENLEDIVIGTTEIGEDMIVEGGVFYRNKNDKDTTTKLRYKKHRNDLLSVTDWTQAPDLTEEDVKGGKTAWAEYRSNLRSLSSKPNWPNLKDEDWPTPPDETMIPIPHRP